MSNAEDLGDGLLMTKVSVGPMDNNAYLLAHGGEQVLIDAANDAGTLLDLVGARGLRAVVTTHRHQDHWVALENFDSLIGDVERKLFGRFGDDTVFHPGHGKDSTLGAERPQLPEWRARGW